MDECFAARWLGAIGIRPIAQSLWKGTVFLLNQARHPLIDAKQVVPIDFTVGGDVRALLVTGPNTGGKTVTLKTAGLFVLLAQSGLFLPCEKAEMPGVARAFMPILAMNRA